jgi:hypothetical protein
VQILHDLFQILRRAKFSCQWKWRKEGGKETCVLMRHYSTLGTFCSCNWHYFWKIASTICSPMQTKRVNMLCQYWLNCSVMVCQKHMRHARHSLHLLTQYGFFARHNHPFKFYNRQHISCGRTGSWNTEWRSAVSSHGDTTWKLKKKGKKWLSL